MMTEKKTHRRAVRRFRKPHASKTRGGKTIAAAALLFISAVLLLAAGSIALYRYTHPLVLRSSVIQLEFQAPFHPLDNVETVYFGDVKDIEIDSEADPEKIGDYTVTYTCRGYSCTAAVQVRDTTPPVLEVQPYSTDLAEELKPELFVKKVSDAAEVTVRFTEELPQPSEGTFDISITAADSSGNCTARTAVLTRTKDTAPPVLSGITDVELMQGGTFDFEQGISVSDDMDPAPGFTVRSDQVDFGTPGTYYAIYTVTDRSGNTLDIPRKVTVKGVPLPDRRIVYLTFDDGPSGNTEKILDILKQYHAKATFFVTGNSQGYNSVLTRILSEGSAIGLHTYTHNYAQIYASEDAYFADLGKISDMVRQVTGTESRIIRFPGGSSNTVSRQYAPGIMTKLTAEVQKKGYQYFDWNCDSGDAGGSHVPAKTLIKNASSGNGQYINILMHDSEAKDTTVEALPGIIKHYQDLGYSFEALTVDSPPVHHRVNN